MPDDFGDGQILLPNDLQLWSNEVGSMLSRFLERLDYDHSIIKKYIDFFSVFIAPALGKFPSSPEDQQTWLSYMTDDHTPVEFSLSYNKKGSTARLAIEPVSRYAGSSVDPLNVKDIDRLVETLSETLGQLDLMWYSVLRKYLMVEIIQSETAHERPEFSLLSQFFLGFDLGRQSIALKAYFVPSLAASVANKTTFQLMSDILPYLEAVSKPLKSSFSMIETYLNSLHVRRPILEIVSVDCCSPLESRLKLYIRDRRTSFQAVWDMYTLGSTLQHVCQENIYQALKQLWYLVLGLPPEFSVKEELDANDHATAGTIYYFSLRAGKSIPEPKVYIPVRHYATNDLEIAHGLSKAFHELGWETNAQSYLKTVQEVFHDVDLKAKTGTQTYISFSLKGGDIAIESYFNPEIMSRLQANHLETCYS